MWLYATHRGQFEDLQTSEVDNLTVGNNWWMTTAEALGMENDILCWEVSRLDIENQKLRSWDDVVSRLVNLESELWKAKQKLAKLTVGLEGEKTRWDERFKVEMEQQCAKPEVRALKLEETLRNIRGHLNMLLLAAEEEAADVRMVATELKEQVMEGWQ